jgi:hypothetical protein
LREASHYAKSGDVHVAYQVFGEGPINLVIVPGFVSNIEVFWGPTGVGPRFAAYSELCARRDL